MRPPRFRLRTLLILVALSAVPLALIQVRRRREHYRVQAELHGSLEQFFRAGIAGMGATIGGRTSSQLRSIREPRRVAYHAALRAKYERAAARPWLPVPPDPPPPD